MSPSTSRSHISNPWVRWWSITSITTISSWCTSTYRCIWIFSIFTLSNCFSIIIIVILLLFIIIPIIISITTTITITIASISTTFFRRGLGGGYSSPCPFLLPLPLTLNVPCADFLGSCPQILLVSFSGVLVVGLDGHWAPPPTSTGLIWGFFPSGGCMTLGPTGSPFAIIDG